MNWGLSQDKSAALLRLAGGEVRAVLSDRRQKRAVFVDTCDRERSLLLAAALLA